MCYLVGFALSDSQYKNCGKTCGDGNLDVEAGCSVPIPILGGLGVMLTGWLLGMALVVGKG